jgi:hypothetical protein
LHRLVNGRQLLSIETGSPDSFLMGEPSRGLDVTQLMKRTRVFLFSMLLATVAVIVNAESLLSPAPAHRLSITAGGTASVFQPDFAGEWTCQPSNLAVCYPVAQAPSLPIFGLGAYADVELNRWAQLEAEARWQRFNPFAHHFSVNYFQHEDNYLVGPRVQVCRFRRSTVSAKALAGISKMNLDDIGHHGLFATLAFGGGIDIKLTKRIVIRAIDAEYQYWPAWEHSTLSPYGFNWGVGYKIF